jgi:hypothetical protein
LLKCKKVKFVEIKSKNKEKLNNNKINFLLPVTEMLAELSLT